MLKVSTSIINILFQENFPFTVSILKIIYRHKKTKQKHIIAKLIKSRYFILLNFGRHFYILRSSHTFRKLICYTASVL